MGAPEDPDYLPRMPPHTAPLAREPRWLGWYGVALCIPACAVAAFGLSAFQAGVSSDSGLVVVVTCAFIAGFFGGVFLLNARSRRAWLAAVLGGLAVASVAACLVGVIGGARVGKSMCQHGSSIDCSVVGRTAPTRQERAEYNEKACARGIRGACGRLARDEGVERAQHVFDGYCASHRSSYRCTSPSVAGFCSGGSTIGYTYSNMCDSDY